MGVPVKWMKSLQATVHAVTNYLSAKEPVCVLITASAIVLCWAVRMDSRVGVVGTDSTADRRYGNIAYCHGVAFS